ncbi:MAG: SRPBCC domain-containing protein [Actinobacteria bacterium]|nr:SRPBCC domain-containing protein [Actinomycetota bacterium]
MTTATETATQTYQLHIKASPEEIWNALTTRAEEYGYRAAVEYDLRPGGAYRGFASKEMLEFGMSDVVIDGEILEVDLPHRLVQTWNPLFDEKISAEPPATLTWETQEGPNGVTRLTLTAESEGAPMTAAITSGSVPEAGGGWPYVLSDLKTLLETGESLAG